MHIYLKSLFHNARLAFSQASRGPQSVAFLSASVLAAYWLGAAAIVLAIPLILLVFYPRHRTVGETIELQVPDSGDTNLMRNELDRVLARARKKSLQSACMAIQIDDFDMLLNRYGRATADMITTRCLDRLARALRSSDQLFNLANGQIGILLAPVRQFGLEPALELAERLQSTVEEPISISTTTAYISVSIGLCLDGHAPNSSGKSMFDATITALKDASRHGPSKVRAYSRGMRGTAPHRIADELEKALESGQFVSWFQPQISTDTGQISGFEALARWVHPRAGLMLPAEFLPVLASTGRLEQLGDAMLRNALKAIQTWDNIGFDIPHVGVNFSPDELRNPRLAEKVEWELDRCNVAPKRLTVEILETVVATSPDDTVARNINALAEMGCLIDLDDFGTGHASISSVRRFPVHRLKIDRSFVMKVDRDVEQQRMISAILSMAERLGLETLAEGVESAGEHTILAQLGCGHVQGYGIARPMPLDETADWIATHQAKVHAPPVIGRITG
ncbi:diguanylate cyclase/phosphodiesterase [Roseovarius marisflavi]|uniref:Diguanylate cyclase/phosphodiesterase n=1 Tax=Roseovarius marisflavi TaxID=1054996 RepID=A0A1M6YWR4_9RHOB|nr:GGDEF domain-containing phosphodiesterase [Roseovarius marisflavi]SHL22764.1 diguanylate cyclase/phosphodiesterase [Roseovarius marisflavi]